MRTLRRSICNVKHRAQWAGTRTRGQRQAWPIFLLALVSWVTMDAPFSGTAAETRPAPEAFLGALLGGWEGRAITTPVGPRPYDIAFEQVGPCAITGVANPGAAIHSWTFYLDSQTLKLRFLTTFRGNTDALVLSAIPRPDGSVVFHSQDASYLRVQVAPGEPETAISIALREIPHVEIRLKRPETIAEQNTSADHSER